MCIFFFTLESYTRDKYGLTIQNQIHIMTFSLHSDGKTNLSRKCIRYTYFIDALEFLCTYIYIDTHTNFYKRYLFNSMQYHFFPEIVSVFIIKDFILITKCLLKMGRWGALVHALTFFIVWNPEKIPFWTFLAFRQSVPVLPRFIESSWMPASVLPLSRNCCQNR